MAPRTAQSRRQNLAVSLYKTLIIVATISYWSQFTDAQFLPDVVRPEAANSSTSVLASALREFQRSAARRFYLASQESPASGSLRRFIEELTSRSRQQPITNQILDGSRNFNQFVRQAFGQDARAVDSTAKQGTNTDLATATRGSSA